MISLFLTTVRGIYKYRRMRLLIFRVLYRDETFTIHRMILFYRLSAESMYHDMYISYDIYEVATIHCGCKIICTNEVVVQ